LQALLYSALSADGFFLVFFFFFFVAISVASSATSASSSSLHSEAALGAGEEVVRATLPEGSSTAVNLTWGSGRT